MDVVECIHDFKSDTIIEALSIEQGEVLYVLDSHFSPDWYFGINARGEEGNPTFLKSLVANSVYIGIFPKAYVHVC